MTPFVLLSFNIKIITNLVRCSYCRKEFISFKKLYYIAWSCASTKQSAGQFVTQSLMIIAVRQITKMSAARNVAELSGIP